MVYLTHSYLYSGRMCLVAMADLEEQIAQVAPFANTDKNGKYTGEIDQ